MKTRVVCLKRHAGAPQRQVSDPAHRANASAADILLDLMTLRVLWPELHWGTLSVFGLVVRVFITCELGSLGGYRDTGARVAKSEFCGRLAERVLATVGA